MKAVAKGRLAVAVLVAAAVALTTMSASAAWPERPVRIVIPWAPGGSTDIVTRILAADLTKRLGQQVADRRRIGMGRQDRIEHRTKPDGAPACVACRHRKRQNPIEPGFDRAGHDGAHS